MEKTKHIPVLLKESLKDLNVKPNGIYIDLTLGGGGHFKEIINKLNGNGIVIGIDKDEKAIEYVRKELSIDNKIGKNYELKKGSLTIILSNNNFVNLSEILKEIKINKVDGIIADLGLSTDQYRSGIGLSYLEDTDLDMRMEKDLTIKASDLLNALYVNELEKLFIELADFSFAKKLAKEIVRYRNEKPIKTTTQLRSIIQKIVPFKFRKGTNKHPEAKVFQALRIAINDEFNSIKQLLPQAFEALYSGGRLVIISFHSGEDKIIKNFFKEKEEENKIKYINKLLKPSVNEIAQNSRSHSAKLRSILKI